MGSSLVTPPLVANGHRAPAMRAGMFERAGFEEILHCRMTIRADHCLCVAVGDGGVFGGGWIGNLDHHHVALIAYNGPT